MGETASEHRVGNLFVVESQCKFAADRSTAMIMIESSEDREFPKAIDELAGTDARNLALGYAAQKGVPDPRINGNTIGPYAVNSKGVPVDKASEAAGQVLDVTHADMQPASYRCEVPICRKLV